jgi:hypothetical protein
MMDTKKLTSEVAARHGLLIRDDDPAMALVTMSEIVLQQVLERAEARRDWAKRDIRRKWTHLPTAIQRSVRISVRFTSPRILSSLMRSPAMMVFPAPGSSASKNRIRGSFIK